MDEAVIIPAYNEGKTITSVITRTKPYTSNIIVIDDGSRDNTASEATHAGAEVLRHRVNLGKGAALKTGCEYALQQGAKIIIVLDADGQHDPAEIPRFQEALRNNDIVFGTRKVPHSMPFVLRFGNQFISSLLKFLYGLNVHDTQCGYRAFSADAYRKICWDALDYYVETEMIIRAGKQKLRHTMVPIQTIYADKYKGTTVLDGVLIVGKMIGWRFWK